MSLRLLWHRSFTFGPGTVTGAMDFIQRQPRRFRVVARQPSRALCLERAQFDEIANDHPEVRSLSGPDSATPTVPHASEDGLCRAVRAAAG